ncbi:AAA family ATPase [Acinetobacter seifertii]|uniref:DEAD/DEAH box helicase n=1 Tax=Acinetobacter seifertii TaxID=1530123 RepID=UPI00321B8F3C
MIKVIWGTNKEKPIASRQLAETLSSDANLNGFLYIGYPIVGSPLGPTKFDALLLSESKGIVAFDLVEGKDLSNYINNQDEMASMLEVKLKPYKKLKQGRNLKFDIKTITFCPSIKNNLPTVDDELYNIANISNLNEIINSFHWESDQNTFQELKAAIQVVTNIRAGVARRQIIKENSLGSRLQKLEDSIANLDQHQSEAVIETVEGVQRIRGLAGSGKTIVLALKVAYLHAQNQSWKIAVTFHTRALKEQFRRLINNFTIEQLGSEPDWNSIDIFNSWGAPGEKENDGMYHRYCVENSIDYYDFQTAKNQFGTDKSFQQVCKLALEQSASKKVEKYDLILIDEAQDFPPEFIKLCYKFLKDPKRLVYAYDELQSLNGLSVLPPEQLFGKDANGVPLVTLEEDDPTQPKKDIILEKCYRNSRPLLATAHTLGFGLTRPKGLVQFFDNDSLWEDVGYSLKKGKIEGGKEVELVRTSESSPLFLEEHTPLEELIKFEVFDSVQDMNQSLFNSILENINEDELKPEDILVINPNPLTTQKNVGIVRRALQQQNIESEIAGVTTSRDIFKKDGAVTFTGIFRAKGNEAAMVYIIHAQDCADSYDPNHLALIRNRLFTAITRSKAWVRILGIGPSMQSLKEEWETLKNNNYSLKFIYPTEKQKNTLKLINKDMSIQERNKRKRLTNNIQEIINAISTGELPPELIPDELINILKQSGK